MSNEELKTKITELLPAATFEEGGEWLNINIETKDWLSLAQQLIVVKSNLDRNLPEIETVSHIWKTAEFHEREVYEMFGVNFLHHPDLRLLILPDGWEGKNPLRKDFEDPINMIKL